MTGADIVFAKSVQYLDERPLEDGVVKPN